MSGQRSDNIAMGYSAQPSPAQGRAGSPSSGSPAMDAATGVPIRSPFSLTGAPAAVSKLAASSRTGATSPSHDPAGGPGRLYSKR